MSTGWPDETWAPLAFSWRSHFDRFLDLNGTCPSLRFISRALRLMPRPKCSQRIARSQTRTNRSMIAADFSLQLANKRTTQAKLFGVPPQLQNPQPTAINLLARVCSGPKNWKAAGAPPSRAGPPSSAGH